MPAKPASAKTKAPSGEQADLLSNIPPDPMPVTDPSGGATERGRAGAADMDAEIAVLATVLTTPETFYDLGDRIVDSDFSVPAHGAIWRAIVACDVQGRPIDIITVSDELSRAGQLEKIGGTLRLERIVASVPDHLSHVEAHGEIVADKSLQRRVITAARDIAAEATKPDVRGEDALAHAETVVFELGAKRQSSNLIPIAQAVPEMLQELAKARTSLLLGHTTGFRDLDRLTAGAQGGQLIVVGARPAMGKSAFALAVARAMAEGSGDPVLFLSYEMSRHELLIRMLSTMIGVDVSELRAGQIPSEMELELAKAAQRLAALPIYIDDQPPETISGVRSLVRRMARRGPLAGVVIDYLQLMSGDRRSGYGDNRQQEVSEVSRGLKRLAREHEVPVIALSQLSRNLESRPNKRPMLSDLRESGAVEQDADCVFFLYRDAVYHPETDPECSEIIIAKQRQGPAGVTVHLRFEGPYGPRFSDRPEGWRPEGAFEVGGPAPAPGGRGAGMF